MLENTPISHTELKYHFNLFLIIWGCKKDNDSKCVLTYQEFVEVKPIAWQTFTILAFENFIVAHIAIA